MPVIPSGELLGETPEAARVSPSLLESYRLNLTDCIPKHIDRWVCSPRKNCETILPELVRTPKELTGSLASLLISCVLLVTLRTIVAENSINDKSPYSG